MKLFTGNADVSIWVKFSCLIWTRKNNFPSINTINASMTNVMYIILMGCKQQSIYNHGLRLWAASFYIESLLYHCIQCTSKKYAAQLDCSNSHCIINHSTPPTPISFFQLIHLLGLWEDDPMILSGWGLPLVFNVGLAWHQSLDWVPPHCLCPEVISFVAGLSPSLSCYQPCVWREGEGDFLSLLFKQAHFLLEINQKIHTNSNWSSIILISPLIRKHGKACMSRRVRIYFCLRVFIEWYVIYQCICTSW